MPELPEVEVLVRNLRPRLKHKTVRAVRVGRSSVLAPTSVGQLTKTLMGKRFLGIARRGKYLLFTLEPAAEPARLLLVGHLGMTGRMYLQPSGTPLPKHAAVVLALGQENLVYEDPRYFGRFTLDASAIDELGPEPLGAKFTVEYFTQALKRSSQPVKVKLLDQSLVAGIGNIYASEALFRAKISPRLPACRLAADQVARLWRAIREVLAEAIRWGSTMPLYYRGVFGQRASKSHTEGNGAFNTERLRVYDRDGQPCSRCGAQIKRLVQAGRSTYYCPACQRK